MMLELKNIYKTYVQGKMDVPVLRNISLAVEQGEYLAIMGPSGSGKTTLMNIIGCLDNPSAGEYWLENQDISQYSDKKMSTVRLHSIGFVFQSFYLLSKQSALENVALPLLYAGVPRKERLEIAKKALERVGLGDRTAFQPTQLSGGQCQRVAIARAIVNNPKILLADEPTGALDTKSGQQIMEIFQGLNDEGVTIIMITHEPEIARMAKRTMHIRDGRLLDEKGNFISPDETEDNPPKEGTADLAETLAVTPSTPIAKPTSPTAVPPAVTPQKQPPTPPPVPAAEPIKPAKPGVRKEEELLWARPKPSASPIFPVIFDQMEVKKVERDFSPPSAITVEPAEDAPGEKKPDPSGQDAAQKAREPGGFHSPIPIELGDLGKKPPIPSAPTPQKQEVEE